MALNILDFYSEKVQEAVQDFTMDKEQENRSYTTGLLPQRKVATERVTLSTMQAVKLPVMPVVAKGQTFVEDSFEPIALGTIELMHFWVQATRSENTIAMLRKKLRMMQGSGTIGDASRSELLELINGAYAKLFYDRVLRWNDLQTFQFDQMLCNPDGFILQGDVHNDPFKYQLSVEIPEATTTLAAFTASPITTLYNNIIMPIMAKGGQCNTIFIGQTLLEAIMASDYWSVNRPLPTHFSYTPAGYNKEVPARGAMKILDMPGLEVVALNDLVKVKASDGTYETIQAFDRLTAVGVDKDNLGQMLWCGTYREDLLSEVDEKVSFYEMTDGYTADKAKYIRSEGNVICALTGVKSMARMFCTEPEPEVVVGS